MGDLGRGSEDSLYTGAPIANCYTCGLHRAHTTETPIHVQIQWRRPSTEPTSPRSGKKGCVPLQRSKVHLANDKSLKHSRFSSSGPHHRKEAVALASADRAYSDACDAASDTFCTTGCTAADTCGFTHDQAVSTAAEHNRSLSAPRCPIGAESTFIGCNRQNRQNQAQHLRAFQWKQALPSVGDSPAARMAPRPERRAARAARRRPPPVVCRAPAAQPLAAAPPSVPLQWRPPPPPVCAHQQL